MYVEKITFRLNHRAKPQVALKSESWLILLCNLISKWVLFPSSGTSAEGKQALPLSPSANDNVRTEKVMQSSGSPQAREKQQQQQRRGVDSCCSVECCYCCSMLTLMKQPHPPQTEKKHPFQNALSLREDGRLTFTVITFAVRCRSCRNGDGASRLVQNLAALLPHETTASQYDHTLLYTTRGEPQG